ncbi:hypothetical protein [uncultured Microscilla sp.]|uniref:hypothetical protein n=1 Tax=uncultured Microscilla sp. TaxID=432653 RepID=UPI002632A4C8|nr:hypothetical protein [uncultured Microscilla sp.]
MFVVGKEVKVFKDSLEHVYLKVYVFEFAPGNVIVLRWVGDASDEQIKTAHNNILSIISAHDVSFLLGDLTFFSRSFSSEYLSNYFKKVFTPKAIALGVVYGAVVELQANPLVAESYSKIKKELDKGEIVLYQRFNTLKKAFAWFWEKGLGAGVFDKDVVYSDDTTEEYLQTQAAQIQEMESQNKRLHDENKRYKLEKRREGKFKRVIRNLVIAFTVLSFLNNVFWRYLDYREAKHYKMQSIKVLRKINTNLYKYGKQKKYQSGAAEKPKSAK